MDEYKVKQLQKMLKHESDERNPHYGARLIYWRRDAKPINIDAGGLKALIDYYSNQPTDLGGMEHE